MNTASEKAQILALIAAINSMEFGKLSEYQHRGRPKDSSSCYRLQIWCDGKNRTRCIRPEELPAIQETLNGHALFRELVDKYANLVVAETRQRMDDPAKKKDPSLHVAFQDELSRVLEPLLNDVPDSALQLELLFRDALLAAGRVLFAPLLQRRIDSIDRDHRPN